MEVTQLRSLFSPISKGVNAHPNSSIPMTATAGWAVLEKITP